MAVLSQALARYNHAKSLDSWDFEVYNVDTYQGDGTDPIRTHLYFSTYTDLDGNQKTVQLVAESDVEGFYFLVREAWAGICVAHESNQHNKDRIYAEVKANLEAFVARNGDFLPLELTTLIAEIEAYFDAGNAAGAVVWEGKVNVVAVAIITFS